MNRFVTWVTSNDAQWFLYFNNQLRCKTCDYIMPKITHLGGALFSITSVLMTIMMSRHTLRLWGIEALFSLALSHVIVHLIKKLYLRERPYVTLTDANLRSNPLKDYSFPSGHTTAAFSIAVAFSLNSPLLAALLIPLASIIAWSRIYLGLHYPTDCFIGALLGTMSSLLVIHGFTTILEPIMLSHATITH